MTKKSKAKTSLWVHGASGRMGLELTALLKNDKTYTLVEGSIDQGKSSEIILDFTSAAGNEALLKALKQQKQPIDASVLIGSTGLTEQTIKEWQKLCVAQKHLRVLVAANTSLGILVFAKTLGMVTAPLASHGYDIELTETHHRQKLDAPSGTALFLAKAMSHANPELTPNQARKGKRSPHEIGIHALRGGGVFGEHQVHFLGDDDELIIIHRARSRTLFAKGALVLVNWLVKQTSGFYTLENVDLAHMSRP